MSDDTTTTATRDDDDGDPGLVRRIVLCSVVTGLVSAAAMEHFQGWKGAVSSLAGTVLGVANLWILATLIRKLFDRSADANKTRAGLLLVAKATGFFVVAGAVVSRPWIDGASFMAGFTAVVVAIAAGALWGPSTAAHSDEGKH